MIGSVKLIPSGFSIIDDNWGGIYKGGSYFVVGPKKSGRSLLALQYSREALNNDEMVLYFTNMRARDLMIQASSINFDIQSHMTEDHIVVVRIASPDDLYNLYNVDDYLIEYMNDIISVVNQYNPSRIVFDELTPYVGFRNLDLLRDSFRHTVEVIEDQDITSLYIVGEPATARAKSIVDILVQQVTGVVNLKKSMSDASHSSQTGTVEIIANVGHPQGQFSEKYNVVPNKGLVITSKQNSAEYEEISKRDSIKFDELEKKEKEEQKVTKQEETPDVPQAKESIKEVKIRPSEFSLTKETITFSNAYDYKDFLLLLNNQIALYKGTGQNFNLISFKLDPAVQVKGYLNSSQLLNAVLMSTTKKDKVCSIDNKVIVLVTNSTEALIQKLISNVPQNLPSIDQDYIKAVLPYISVLNMEVDENVANGEMMMNLMLSAAMLSSYRKLASLNLG